MSVYTQVFGGTTIYPSDVSYLAITLAADTTLQWPLENSTSNDVAAPILDVDPTASGFSIILPAADNTGTGQTMLFNNVSASDSFYIKDADGNTLATVAYGEQWQVYLSDNSSAAGVWRVFRYGASTATVQPSALAGAGLTTAGSTLAQSAPVTTFNSGSLSGGVFTLSTANRAGVFVWNDTGTATVALPTAVSAGNGWFVAIRNEGGGVVTIDPAGVETINGLSSISLNPDDSAVIHTDGTTWYTVGLGQQAVFAFDYTSITVTGGTYTLSGSELNRIAYKFVGTLTSNVTIIVPSTIQQYWINNATTGSYTLSVSTSGGTPVQVNQNARGIYYCDGTNVILADTASVALPITISQGGTSASTASGARLNLGITSFADAIVTATTASSVRSTISAAESGSNSDITELTGLTTPLAVSEGGTGTATTFTPGSIVFAANPSGIYAQDNSNLFWDDSNNRLGVGTSTPAYRIHSQESTGTIGITSATGNNQVYLVLENNAGKVYLARDSSTGGGFGVGNFATTLFAEGAYPMVLGTNSSRRLTISATGNVSIGAIAPHSWTTSPGTGTRALEVGYYTSLCEDTSGPAHLSINTYESSATVWKYITSGVGAGRIDLNFGEFVFQNAPSGTAGATATFTERMRLSAGGMLGVSVVPNNWVTLKGVQVPGGAFIGYAGGAGNNQVAMQNNAYFDGADYRYITSDTAQRFVTIAGDYVWSNAASGTAGAVVSFTQRMTLDAVGNLAVGAPDANGSASNQTVLAAGIHTTAKGATATGAASAAWTNAVTLSSYDAVYLFSMTMTSTGDPNSYSALYLVRSASNGTHTITAITSGSAVAARISTATIQVQQNSGNTGTPINWSLTRLV